MNNKLFNIYLVIIIILMLAGYYFFRLDDAYIFYTYAKNIAEGNGYVFNIGEKVNATTSPLYTLLLSGIYFVTQQFFSIDFAVIGILVSAASILLLICSAKKIFVNDKQFYLFTFLFLSTPLLKFGFGMETFLNLTLIFLAIQLYISEKLLAASAVLGLTVLARFDSILFCGVIFLHYLIVNKKFPSLKFIVVFVLVIAPWFIFSNIYFDSFLPTTIGAKLSQQEIGIFGEGLIFLSHSARLIPGGYLTISVLIFLLTFSLVYIHKKQLRIFNNNAFTIIIIWSGLLFITYTFILQAPPYQWYYTPFVVPVAVIFAIAAADFLKENTKLNYVITILFIASCVLPIKSMLDGYTGKYITFTSAAKWLNNYAEQGDLVGMDDIGMVGYYYKKGKLVDALGLINPEVAPHLKEKDFDWFLDYYKPVYVVHEYPELMEYLRGNEKKFWQTYDVQIIFESPYHTLAIYKRKF